MQVIKFGAPWCGPCKVLNPIFEKVSHDWPDIKFVDINVDDNDEMAVEYNIKNVPTICIVNGNKVLSRHSGGMTETGLRKFLGEWLPNNTKTA